METMQKTGERLFIRYIAKHPLEFFLISVQKAYSAIILMLRVPINWPPISFFLISMLGLRYIIYRRTLSNADFSSKSVKEIVFVFIILMLVAALPAILTSPYYGQATYPPAAVMFFTGIFATYMIFRFLFQKCRVDRNANLD
jgi:hypothetical protein